MLFFSLHDLGRKLPFVASYRMTTAANLTIFLAVTWLIKRAN